MSKHACSSHDLHHVNTDRHYSICRFFSVVDAEEVLAS